ncbi:MAG: diguanylate cyclase (GGDEF)-like protein/PAS domain S-box-containing protein [Paraglaciecola sp.]|jgi:diguanylate cyclase (GGDEF)-like protein/PAS domain S-box-containing protein
MNSSLSISKSNKSARGIKKDKCIFFICSMLMLVCTVSILFMFSKIKLVLQNINIGYSAVSNSTRDIRINTLSSQLLLVDFIHEINDRNMNELVLQKNRLDNDIHAAFDVLKKNFWGDKNKIDVIKNIYLGWQSVRDKTINVFLLNDEKSALQDFLQQNTQLINITNQKLQFLTETTNNMTQNITKRSRNKALKILQIELAILFSFLCCLFAMFYTLQRRIAKEKKTVTKALIWANQLIDYSPDAMIISDRNGNITQTNKKSEDLFGYSKSEFQGLNIAKLMPQNFENHHENIKQFFKSSSSRKMGLGKTLSALNKSGRDFPVEISLNLAELDERKVAITIIRDITDKKQNEATLIHQANHDLLTKLPNRKLIHDRLNQAINRANRSSKKFGVLFIDLDGFKKINDNYGHECGDNLLICISNKLRALLRAEDTIGRLGGDEYLVIIPDIIQNVSLKTIVHKIFQSFENIEPIDGKKIQIGASIGLSIYPDDGIDCENLIRNADLAMYDAKKISNKNSYVFFKEAMLNKMATNHALEIAIKQAYKNNEFYVLYQPIFDIKSLKTLGFEALLRWSNPSYKHLTPEDYVPILEKNNLINQVGKFVLQKSIEDLKYWQKMTGSDLCVAVNISPYQLKDPILPATIKTLLDTYQLDGRYLEIELTERSLIEPSPMLEQMLLQLRKLGVGIALDDFGTCYSSMYYLTRYPITCLKIDKSFVDGIDEKKGNDIKRVLVDTTVSLAQSLNMTVTAEGIELEKQIKYLQSINCDHGQGFYFSKPLTFEGINSLMQKEVKDAFITKNACVTSKN